MADISSVVQESLSVWDPARQDHGSRDELADRFTPIRSRFAGLEVRQRMAGRWVMASIQTSFAVMPAAVYWFGGYSLPAAQMRFPIPLLVAFTTLQTRLFFPGRVAARGGARRTDIARPFRPHLRVPRRAGRHRGKGRMQSPSAAPATSFSTASGSATATSGRSRMSRSPWPRARRRRWWRPAPARPRLATSRRGSTTSAAGRITIGGTDIRDLTFGALADLVGVVSQETYLFHASVRENLRFAKPDATDEEIEGGRASGAHPLVIAALPDGYETSSANGAIASPAARSSGSRSRARSSATPRSSSSTRPRLARHRDRTARAGGARPAVGGAHDDRDRPPPIHRPGRRPDHRSRPRQRRGVRAPRGLDRGRSALLRPREPRRAARRPRLTSRKLFKRRCS